MKQFDQIGEQLDDIEPRIACLIHLYIFEALTPSQQVELDSWIGDNESNRRTFMEATNEKVLMEGLDFMDHTIIQQPLEKLRGKLHFTEKPATIIPYWRWVAAASVIFLLGVGAAIYRSQDSVSNDISPGGNRATLSYSGSNVLLDQEKEGFIELQNSYSIIKEDGHIKYTGSDTNASRVNHLISTPRAGTYPIILSDGTKIWLNPSSSISFPPVFPASERKVTITGEVFFEVASVTLPKGGKKPFIVEVKDKGVKVEVLGTHFNINAYPDEPSVKTTLIEGSVKITTTKETTMLKPNQQAEVKNNNTEHIDVSDVGDAGAAAAMAWKEGHFNFQKADTRTLLREIARWYDMEIEYAGEVPTRHFGGQVDRNTELKELMKTLRLNGIECKIRGKKIVVTPIAPAQGQ